jgi:hypothetical protein
MIHSISQNSQNVSRKISVLFNRSIKKLEITQIECPSITIFRQSNANSNPEKNTIISIHPSMIHIRFHVCAVTRHLTFHNAIAH